MKRYELQMINDYINQKDIIYEDEFKRFFFELFPDRSEKYYNYYTLYLYRQNILYKYGRNRLKPCKYRKVFNFELEIESRLKYRLENISPAIVISIWNTYDLSHLTSLQMLNNITIVETYSYAKEYLLNFLLEQGKFAFYEEDYSVMSKYNRKTQLYMVRTMYEECPIIKKSFSSTRSVDRLTFITVPKIEKLIVDLVLDEIYKMLFSSEIDRIINQLLKNYQINITTVLRYARKKHSTQKILDYLEYIGFDVESGELI